MLSFTSCFYTSSCHSYYLLFMHVSSCLPFFLSTSSIIVLQEHAHAGQGVQWRRAPGDPRSAFQFAGCQVKRKSNQIWESMWFSVQQYLVSFTIHYVSCILWSEPLWMLLFFIISLFLTLSSLFFPLHLFFFFYVLLQAVFFTDSDSSGHFFFFVSLSAETPRPYPAPLISQLKSLQWEKEQMKVVLLLTAVFFSHCVLLSFYSNLCPLLQRCPLRLKGDSGCFLFLHVFFSFLNGWVSMTGDKRRNAPSL